MIKSQHKYTPCYQRCKGNSVQSQKKNKMYDTALEGFNQATKGVKG